MNDEEKELRAELERKRKEFEEIIKREPSLDQAVALERLANELRELAIWSDRIAEERKKRE